MVDVLLSDEHRQSDCQSEIGWILVPEERYHTGHNEPLLLALFALFVVLCLDVSATGGMYVHPKVPLWVSVVRLTHYVVASLHEKNKRFSRERCYSQKERKEGFRGTGRVDGGQNNGGSYFLYG